MAKTLSGARYLLSETDPARLAPCAAEVSFVGRSNVGKSSLLNAICRAGLAHTSNTPGRTRAINVYEAAKDAWLVDLPGYGFALGPVAERAAWPAMIEGYLTGRPGLRMVYALIDARVGPTRLDLDMLKWLEHAGLPWRPLAVKADQVKRSRAAAQRTELAHAMGVERADLAWVSAEEGYGVPELRAEVCALLGL